MKYKELQERYGNGMATDILMGIEKMAGIRSLDVLGQPEETRLQNAYAALDRMDAERAAAQEQIKQKLGDTDPLKTTVSKR
jgi:hypothetical protein